MDLHPIFLSQDQVLIISKMAHYNPQDQRSQQSAPYSNSASNAATAVERDTHFPFRRPDEQAWDDYFTDIPLDRASLIPPPLTRCNSSNERSSIATPASVGSASLVPQGSLLPPQQPDPPPVSRFSAFVSPPPERQSRHFFKISWRSNSTQSSHNKARVGAISHPQSAALIMNRGAPAVVGKALNATGSGLAARAASRI